MKHLTKALAAFSLLTAASAVHAQTVYYGTNFDRSTTFPYNDGTNYGGPGFQSLNGVGNWTATAGYAVTVGDGPGNTVAQVYSGNGAATASHATAATPTGYIFQTDFEITPNNADASTAEAENPGNQYAFTFNSTTGTTLFSVAFAPTAVTGGVEGAYTPELLNAAGMVVSTATTGPDVGAFFHLTIFVTSTGSISASLGTAASTLTGAITGAGSLGSFVVGETDVPATTQLDAITFDNVSVVPEPSTYAMMGLGLLGMLGLMKFRRARA